MIFFVQFRIKYFQLHRLVLAWPSINIFILDFRHFCFLFFSHLLFSTRFLFFIFTIHSIFQFDFISFRLYFSYFACPVSKWIILVLFRWLIFLLILLFVGLVLDFLKLLIVTVNLLSLSLGVRATVSLWKVVLRH